VPTTSPHLVFATPRGLPDPRKLFGRVVVLDIAFGADGMGTPFEETTRAFIDALAGRLAAWVDHHDHERHREFAGDPRFYLANKADHGACPEMVTPEIVKDAGPIDTIVCHGDLDGLYSAAKWLLLGKEPYPGADDDARAVDTRIGQPGPVGERIDKALRARFRDEGLKHRVVKYLVGGLKDRAFSDEIGAAALEFERSATESERLAGLYERRGRAVVVDAGTFARGPYDKTLLLLKGQTTAEVAIVRDAGTITLAAAFDSGIDFIKLLELGGGMPTRVSLKESRLEEVLEKLNRDSRVNFL
jgi:hypothetical protein